MSKSMEKRLAHQTAGLEAEHERGGHVSRATRHCIACRFRWRGLAILHGIAIAPQVSFPLHEGHEDEGCYGCSVEDGRTGLIAAGYEWTCRCGVLNTVVGIAETVTCGAGDKYGAPHPSRPVKGCGRTFEVDTFSVHEAYD